MNLDTLARHAADTYRASAEGVDAHEALSELRQTAGNRRRATVTVQALAVVAVLTGVAWFSLGPGAMSGALPPAAPGHTSDVQRAAGTVGSNLATPITATVPPGYTVSCDCGYISLTDATNAPNTIFVEGPVDSVFDPRTGSWVKTPADYAAWLRANPWIEVLTDAVVYIDGQPYPALTVRVRPDARLANGSAYDLPFAHSTGIPGTQPYSLADAGDVFTEVPVTFDGQLVVIHAEGAYGKPTLSVEQALVDFVASIRF